MASQRNGQTELVSVLVRSMDRPSLPRTLDSIAAQTWPSLEIVVAAACGHGHAPLPSEHRGRPMRLVRADKDGRLPRPVAANLCLGAARGEWLNFLDDDDEFLPSHIETLMRAPCASGERVVYSRTRVVDDTGRILGHCGFAGFHAQLYFQSRSTPAGTLFHRSLVDEGAAFDEAFDLLENHDFFVNLATRSLFRFVDEVTAIWHASAGESGAGFGANYRPERLQTHYAHLRGKWAEAFGSWTRSFEALLFLGQHSLRCGDDARALEILENALRQRPGDVNALNLCGMACFGVGDLARASTLLERAARQLPNHAGIAQNLARVRAAKAACAGGEQPPIPNEPVE